MPNDQHSFGYLDVVPELPVTDLARAQSWFHDALGFQTAWVWEDSFAAVSSGEVQRYLRKSDSPTAPARCYLHVVDANSLYLRCQQHGARTIDELASKAWSSGVFVGRVGFWNPEGWPGFELGWVLRRSFWHQGYATEAARVALQVAFAQINQPRVISLIAPGNVASIRVAERLGQHLSGSQDMNGKTVLVYGISREEWELATNVR
jgi:RimJ/RimL family protein N-acetyltransferase